jgi:hypothetical protein
VCPDPYNNTCRSNLIHRSGRARRQNAQRKSLHTNNLITIVEEVMRTFVVTFLIACGPSLKVKHVDPCLEEAYQEIADELDALGYAGVLSHGTDGISVVSNTQRVQSASDASESGVIAFFDHGDQTIVMPGAYEWVSTSEGVSNLSPKGIRMTLAHELGHAMGLRHSDHGLMQPKGNPERCVDAPGACLVDALREQGSIN